MLFAVVLLCSVSTVFADWETSPRLMIPFSDRISGNLHLVLPLVYEGLDYHICKDTIVTDANETTVILEGMDDVILTGNFDLRHKIGQPVTIYASYQRKTDEYTIVWVKDESGIGFEDTKGLPCENAVAALRAFHVLSGYEDGTFRPNQSVTRAELASLAVRCCGVSTGKQTNTYFPDVPKEHWASGDIKLAELKKIMVGDENGEFHPEKAVTIEETIKVLVCLLGYEYFALIKGGYPDGYIEQAKELGLLDGKDDLLENTQSECTRGIIAELLFPAILEIPLCETVYY